MKGISPKKEDKVVLDDKKEDINVPSGVKPPPTAKIMERNGSPSTNVIPKDMTDSGYIKSPSAEGLAVVKEEKDREGGKGW